jgi:hypothetical protein
VGEGDASAEFVGDENSCAIGDINPKAEAALASHQGVAIRHGKFVAGENLPHGISVDLHGGGEWHSIKPSAVEGGAVDRCQASHGGVAVGLDIQAGDAAKKAGSKMSERVERGKSFERGLLWGGGHQFPLGLDFLAGEGEGEGAGWRIGTSGSFLR